MKKKFRSDRPSRPDEPERGTKWLWLGKKRRSGGNRRHGERQQKSGRPTIDEHFDPRKALEEIGEARKPKGAGTGMPKPSQGIVSKTGGAKPPTAGKVQLPEGQKPKGIVGKIIDGVIGIWRLITGRRGK